VPRGAKSRMRRTETPKPIWIKFCVVVDIPDIVTYTNFGDHRLRGFWVAGGQISPSPVDFHRRPYNTLAQRVMDKLQFIVLICCNIHTGFCTPGSYRLPQLLLMSNYLLKIKPYPMHTIATVHCTTLLSPKYW